MGSYRKRLDIVADILGAANENATVKKTQLMYKANLSHTVLQKYVAEIIGAGLLSFKPEKREYEITMKGLRFLESYRDYRSRSKYFKRLLSEIDDKKSKLQELCPAN